MNYPVVYLYNSKVYTVTDILAANEAKKYKSKNAKTTNKLHRKLIGICKKCQ